MNLEILEGYIEIKGKYPILITALHGFGSDYYRILVKALKKYLSMFGYIKTLNSYNELEKSLRYSSSVDVYTWEIAFKVSLAEELWCILPTLSKVDSINGIGLPDYNLNKSYASITPFWKRTEEIVKNEKIKVVIDIHGMKNIKKWPDICISTRGLTTASKQLVDKIATFFRVQGFKVAIDYPFAGGAFIATFGKPPIVEAMAIEIKKNLRFQGSKIPKFVRGAIRVVKEYVEKEKDFKE